MDTHYIRSVELLADTINDNASYPFSLPAVRQLRTLTFHPHVTFIIGENGSGKSTLLEAIAVEYGLNAEGGSKNFTFSTRRTHSELYKHIRIARGVSRPRDSYFLRAESYYNLATNIDALDEEPGGGRPLRDSYGGASLHEQSHGESFFALFTQRLGGQGMYLFDEPEAALSPQRQMALLVRMHELVQQKSQFIIATHSPILLAYPDALIYQLSDDGYQETPYRETEQYQLYHTFLDRPALMLERLGIAPITFPTTPPTRSRQDL